VERSYAGMLGLVAFATCLAHGWIHGAGIETSLFRAWICLLVFTLLGWMTGAIAAKVVDEAVRSRVTAELAAREAARSAKAAKASPAVVRDLSSSTRGR
jgi:hypothetical protein